MSATSEAWARAKSIRLIFGAMAGDTPRGVSSTNKRSKPRCRKFRIAISQSVLCNVTLCNYFQLVLIFNECVPPFTMEFFTFQLRRNKARYLRGTFPHSPRLEPDLPL